MQSKSVGKNLMFVAFSRLISLSSSIFVGFLLPKLLSVADYGYYKVFTLYAVYTALLHFGFVDGILLKLAGKHYDELNKEKLRAYTRFFAAFELVISVLMIAVGVIVADGESLFIVISLALNMLFVNITTYYQFVSQAVQRFGEYSAKNLIVSAVKLAFVLMLYAVYALADANISYRVYLVGLNVLDLLMAIWYIAIYREITFGKSARLYTLKKDILDVFKTGLALTVAYQVSHIVLALDRQFVSALFSTETFAVYSFAYNIVTLISTMISSVSVVLLPVLKSRTRDLAIASYQKCGTLVSIVAACSLLSYFPLVSFIGWFLPQYQDSVNYISVVLPAFLFTAVITVVQFTMAKVLDMTFSFFKDSCVVLFLGLLTNTAAYMMVKSPIAISYASFVVMAIWFLIAAARLREKTGVGMHREFFYLLINAIGFFAISKTAGNGVAGCITYGALFAVWTAIIYFPVLRETVSAIRERRFRHK